VRYLLSVSPSSQILSQTERIKDDLALDRMGAHLAITERRVWIQRTKVHHTTTLIPHTTSVSSHNATVSHNVNGSYNVNGPSQNKLSEGSSSEEAHQRKVRQRIVHWNNSLSNIGAHNKGAQGRQPGKILADEIIHCRINILG